MTLQPTDQSLVDALSTNERHRETLRHLRERNIEAAELKVKLAAAEHGLEKIAICVNLRANSEPSAIIDAIEALATSRREILATMEQYRQDRLDLRQHVTELRKAVEALLPAHQCECDPQSGTGQCIRCHAEEALEKNLFITRPPAHGAPTN